MSVQELKGSMVELLAGINDQALLEQMYGMMQEMATDEDPAIDWWDELPAYAQQELEAALKESDDEEALVSHGQVKNMMKQWLNK